MNVDAFNRVLADEGLLVAASAAPLPVARVPWHVVALSGFGAWLAAGFVFAALGVGLSPVLGSSLARGVVGFIGCAVCAYVARKRGATEREIERRQVYGIAEPEGSSSIGGVFGAQFQTAISLAGFGLIVSALLPRVGMEVHASPILAGIEVTAVALALWWLNPEPAHRHLMAWSALAAMLATLHWNGEWWLATPAIATATTLIWLTQSRWTAFGARHAFAALGVAAAGLLMICPGVFSVMSWPSEFGGSGGQRPGMTGPLDGLPAFTAWLPAALTTLCLIVASLIITGRHRAGVAFRAGVCAAIVLLTVVSWRAPGIVACLLVRATLLWAKPR